MKKIGLLIIVLWSSYLFSQESKLDSVITKFKSDKKSYEQFVFFGYLNCCDKFFNTESFYNAYLVTYNGLTPLSRLIRYESLKKYFEFHQNSNNNLFENNKLSNSYYAYEIVKRCHKIYSKNAKIKKLYIRLVSDKNSYNEDPEIEDYMNDYLENYFIRIQVD